MLIFSTKLIVNEKLTKEVFIELIIKWLSNNRNYKFGQINYNNDAEFILNKGTDNLEIESYPDVLTVHLTSESQGIIWTNDYVFTQAEGKKVLAIQLYSDAKNMSVKMPEKFNKPRVLKQVVEQGYGGLDYNLPVSNEAFLITEKNIQIASQIVGRESSYFMPVIYVSYPRYAIEEVIDFKTMAANLSGIAHVVVETKEIASSVRRITEQRNPYAGAVDIFYGKNSSYRVLPGNYNSLEEMRRFIESSVQQKILMTRIDDAYSWMKIHFAHMQSKNEEDPELISLYKQLLKVAEEEGDLEKAHIDELEYHIMELDEKINELNMIIAQKDSKLQTYEYKFEQSGKDASTVQLAASEKELYLGEIKDVILKVLEKERNRMDSDPNLVVSRKFHVLEDILRFNIRTGKADEIKKCLENILDKSGNLNAQRKRQLVEAGFDIEIGTHYKITFNGDGRYTFTLSKTAGDHRSNKNTLTDAVNTLFGR